MMKSIIIAVLVLGSMISRGLAQSTCSNSGLCTSNCISSSAADSCCVWDTDIVPSMNASSLNERDGRPLGFQTYPFPGVDSSDSPPCIRINFDTPNVFNYVILALETRGRVCVGPANARGTANDQELCGTNGVFFCNFYTGVTFVDLDYYCTGSCESADFSFFMKAIVAPLESEDEFFCGDNGTIPLPSSLIVRTDVPNVDVTTIATEGAPRLVSLQWVTLFLAIMATFLVKSSL